MDATQVVDGADGAAGFDHDWMVVRDTTTLVPSATRRVLRADVVARRQGKLTSAGALAVQVAQKPKRSDGTHEGDTAADTPAAAGFEKQKMLPFWPADVRGLPPVFAASPLFNARNRNQKRIQLNDVELYVIGTASAGTARLLYRGEELRQVDQKVWLQLVQIAKSLPVGMVVEFTAYAFCKAIHWAPNKGSYERLRKCLARMQATSLTVISDRFEAEEGVSLSMIPVFQWQNPRTGKPLARYKVALAPPLVAMYGGNAIPYVQWRQRLMLPDGLATWLHGYYSCHRDPHPVRLETIRLGAGLSTANQKHLRELVEQALAALKDVKFLRDGRVEGGLVHVKRQHANNEMHTVEQLTPRDIDL
ncbi:plasmid replication initiator TrfA [Burkholderia sp. M6-3]